MIKRQIDTFHAVKTDAEKKESALDFFINNILSEVFLKIPHTE